MTIGGIVWPAALAQATISNLPFVTRWTISDFLCFSSLSTSHFLVEGLGECHFHQRCIFVMAFLANHECSMCHTAMKNIDPLFPCSPHRTWAILSPCLSNKSPVTISNQLSHLTIFALKLHSHIHCPLLLCNVASFFLNGNTAHNMYVYWCDY